MSENGPDNQNDLKSLADNAAGAMQRGDAAGALRVGLEVLKADPKNLTVLRLCAAAAAKLREWRAAVKICEQWRSSYPDDADAIRAMANAYFEIGDAEKSRDTYRVLVDANPSAEHLGIYARLCLGAFDYEGAAAALEKAQSFGPPSAENLYGLARLKLFLGELDEAEALSAKAIETNPNFAMAYAQYVTLRGGDVSNEIGARIERLAVNSAQPPEHRATLHFALGEIRHFKGAYGQAMQAFDSGNAITGTLFHAEGLAYDAKVFERHRMRENSVFKNLPQGRAFSPGPAIPIFVVGMPRSGTTLIESILASHPDVFGAGELGALPVIHNHVLRWAENEGGKTLADASISQLQVWRDQYFAGYPDIKGARFVVDKQPLNFRGAGLIKSLFPEAVIIHIRRNPVDTCFSIYRNDFGKAWPYAVSLHSIAHFYGEYARISARWREVLGPAFPLVVYETLIADFETEARRLIDLCGLDWRDECLEFHKTRRAVATFSSAQVRQPLRKTRANTRDKYGDLLAPLIDGLESAGVDIETGALKG